MVCAPTGRSEHVAAARHVSSLLRTSRAFRESLAFIADDGTKPVVIASLTDRVPDLFGRIARDYPAGANVVVGASTGRPVPFVVRRLGSSAPFAQCAEDCPVHPGSEVGMPLAHLVIQRGHSVRCRFIQPAYEAELDELA